MKIAIVRLTAMGDVIHALASLQFLKRDRPDIHITWFVEEKFAAVLAHNPDVDAVVPVNLHALKKHFSFGVLGEIIQTVHRNGPFDLVIDVQGLIKSAILARIAGSNVAGLDRESAKEGPAVWLYRHRYRVDCSERAVWRFGSLIAQALQLPWEIAMYAHKAPYLFYDPHADCGDLDAYFSREQRNIVIITGASNASKTYPADRWEDVVQGLGACRVLLVAGSEQERLDAEAIAEQTQALILPKMTLDQLKYVIGRCDLLIGGDTGPSHMAWAMNRPSILLFGSTPPAMMMETPINLAITSGAKVDPCRFDKTDRSITTIAPECIVAGAERLLA